MYSRKTDAFLALLLISALFSACVDDKTKSESDVPSISIRISVAPAATTLPTGGTVLFTADVKGAGTTPTGEGNNTVTWRVDEGRVGGTITSKGGYTAPNTAGTFHVTAESQGDKRKTATATVTVSTALDPTFGKNGKVRTGFSGNAVINALLKQADEKVIVGGFALNGDKNSFALARYQSDGSLDTTFGTEGIVTTALSNSQINALALQSDGKIIAAGFAQGGFDAANTLAINSFALIRYQSDGSLDTTFGSNGIMTQMIDGNSEINAVSILSNGKILVAGLAFNTKNKDTDFVLARYHPDGSLDTSFGIAGIASTDISGKDDAAEAMVIQTNGKIVLGGVASTGAGKGDFALARYHANGTLDTSFGSAGTTLTDVSGDEDRIKALALQADGKIVAGGFALIGTANDFALVRYDSSGIEDVNFGAAGTTITNVGGGTAADQINTLVLQADGKILAGGFALIGTANDFALVRYDSSGTLDPSFGVAGIATTPVGSGGDAINGLLLQAGGKILVAGSAVNGTRSDFALAQYDADGTLDGAFATAGKLTLPIGGGNDEINAIGVQADGKIVAAGFSFDGFAVARYNQNGTLDTTFNTDGKIVTNIGGSDSIHALVIQTDSKIVVGGVTSNNTDDDFALVRYHADGSPDATFGVNGVVTTSIAPPALGNNDAVNSLVLQADGKILAAGVGSVATGITDTRKDFALIRYNANGSLDTSFDLDGKVTTQVGTGPSFGQASAIQADGKILVAGHASNGADFDFALVRYQTNGALDATFGLGGIVTTPIAEGGHEIANAIGIQTDGKIVVAGGAFTGGSTGQFILVRYNSDGTLDATFGTGGIVTTSLGTLESRVTALTIQNDGKILAAGFTFSEQNKRDSALVRYNSDGSLDTTFGVGGIEISPFSADIDEIHSLALQSDGKIVAGGTAFDDDGSNADFHLARYNP